MKAVPKGELVLALYPFTRGYSFVLFEGPESPFDWGVKEIKEKHRNVKTLESIKDLITRYTPEVMVIEDTSQHSPRRASRIKKLYRMLTHLACTEHVELHYIQPLAVKQYFAAAGAVRKYEIAHAVTRQLPAFAHRMPYKRKSWMNADPRQSLFDAAALGLTYFGNRGIPSPYEDL